MNLFIKNAEIYYKKEFIKANVFIVDGIIADISSSLSAPCDAKLIDLNNAVIFPGFTDVHVHLREPGFSYKETIKSGTMAAAHGGYTTVCSMPNLNPVPDSVENLKVQLRIIEKDACIKVLPYGAITIGEKGETLSDMNSIAKNIIAFSDDGKGVQDPEMMKKAMLEAKGLGKIIAAHCEDNSLLDGGYIHKGEYAALFGHKGISSESEWRQIERDLALAEETGAAYHVCHISTKKSVEIIRQAKKSGVNVTCETGPHYLVLDDSDLEEDGRFKMNPPLRSTEDRLALIKGIKDGTIDMIATDHAPHSTEEKSRGLEKSLMGVVGIETAFPICYTKLVKTGIITINKLIDLLHFNPNDRFGINAKFEIGKKANLTAFDLNEKHVIYSDNFMSKGRATPFENEEVYGKCMLTIADGKIAFWENDNA